MTRWAGVPTRRAGRVPPSRTVASRKSPVADTLHRFLSTASGLPGYSTSSGAPRNLSRVRHDVLDAGVILEPVRRQVLAVAGGLEAAVRHLGHQRDVRVDPHAAEVQRSR